MDFEPHSRFFHYTTAKAAFEHILPDGQLRFSRYLDMRDPLENKSWRFLGGGWGGDQNRQFADYVEFNRRANYIRERSFLLSMTIDVPPHEETQEEEPFCWGWARARMWEQYAERHEGVCLVFDREQLIAAMKSSLHEQGFAEPYNRSVIYDGRGMQKPLLDMDALSGNVTPEKVAEYIEENHDVLFFHKALDWQTEHEYRFSTTSSGTSALYAAYEDSLTHVIVGERFPNWQRFAAIEACRQAGAEPLRLDWSMGAPILVPLQPIQGRIDEIREIGEAVRASDRQANPPGNS